MSPSVIRIRLYHAPAPCVEVPRRAVVLHRQAPERGAGPLGVLIFAAVESYEKELSVAKTAAREAGAVIMRHYAHPTIDVDTKADKSPVTAADLEANAAIIAALATAFPD